MLPTFVVSQPFSTPVGDGERRVIQDVVGFQAGVAVVVEAVAVGRPAVAVSGGVGADEVDGLYEHTRGTAAGVVDPSSVGLKHLHQKPHERTRRVELAAFLEGDLSERG